MDLVDATLARRLNELGDEGLTNLLCRLELGFFGAAGPDLFCRALTEGEVGCGLPTDEVVNHLFALAAQQSDELARFAHHVRAERAREPTVGGEENYGGALDLDRLGREDVIHVREGGDRGHGAGDRARVWSGCRNPGLRLLDA